MDKELNKLVSPESILIINSNGVLMRLKCPFRVKCVWFDSLLIEGEFYQVHAVALNEDEIMVYIVKGKPYYYYYFLIIL